MSYYNPHKKLCDTGGDQLTDEQEENMTDKKKIEITYMPSITFRIEGCSSTYTILVNEMRVMCEPCKDKYSLWATLRFNDIHGCEHFIDHLKAHGENFALALDRLIRKAAEKEGCVYD